MQRINPALTEKPYWALLLGIVILVMLTAIPILGSLIKIAVVLLGLGAINDALGLKAGLLQGGGENHGLVTVIFNYKC